MQNETQQQATVQPTQAVQQQIFYPERVQRSYTVAQWKLKEDWYVKEIQNINIPMAPNPSDIANTAILIEKILSTARLDMAFVKQAYDKFSMCLKIEEKRMYLDLTLTSATQYPGVKFTVADKEGLVVKTVEGKKWDNTSYNLYDLVKDTSSRYTFMDGVIKALCDKKDLLITHSSVMKAEVSLNGFTQNVPGIPQENPQGYGGN